MKPTFRVRSEDGVSYTLTAADEHDRKQWINALQDGISKATKKQQKTKLTNTVSDSDFVVKTSKTEQNPAVLLRRSSSVKLPQEFASPANRNRSKTLGHHVTPPGDDKTPTKTLQSVVGEQKHALTEQEKTPSNSSFSKLRRRLSLRLSTGEIERSPSRKSRSLTSSPVVSRMDSLVDDGDQQHNKQNLRQCVSLPNTQAVSKMSARRERYLTRSRSLARVDDLSIVLEDEQIPAATGITPEDRLSTSLLNLSTESHETPDHSPDVKVAWEEDASSPSEDLSLICQQVLTEIINTVCNDTAKKFTRTISRVELREVRPPTALETQV